jgi:hypothetical protein
MGKHKWHYSSGQLINVFAGGESQRTGFFVYRKLLNSNRAELVDITPLFSEEHFTKGIKADAFNNNCLDDLDWEYSDKVKSVFYLFDKNR